MSDKKTNLIWLDLEMTGLDPLYDRILEIATIVTDTELNIVAYGPEIVIHQNDSILGRMNAWVANQHTKSGLITKVQASKISDLQAEQMTLEFLAQYVEIGTSPMCGNSICMDRRFLIAYMPTLAKYFHYRHLDVSSLKILAQNWAPHIAKNFIKNSNHRALDDVRLSIDELKYYRQHLLSV
jgi:oligoribonuclease